MNISIKLKNIDEIKAKLSKMPQAMTKELGTAVKQTISKVQRETIKEAPVNKGSGGGNLRQSITSQMTGSASGKLEVGSSYGVFVHEGTRPHTIYPKNKKALANVRTGQFFGRKVEHTGTRANKFLQRAVQNSETEVQNFFSDAVARVAKL